ncbi:MAG: GNAT family N-acetyltransferase, partial [Tabrizicola sp.]|nr:GNAT family N-acetyltransferase [Tabrizicola sp.]
MALRARLRTARLTLRPLVASDQAALVGQASDLEVSRWLTVVPYPYKARDFRAFLPRAHAGRVWVIADEAGFQGLIALESQFGYWLGHTAWGRGYATEAAGAVLAAHFADPAARPVVSGYFLGNDRSARVLAKLGFVETGQGMKHVLARKADARHIDMLLTRDGFARANPLVIETARLRLAPLDADRDWEALSRIGGRPEVARMLMSVPSPWPETLVRDWIRH